MAVEQKKEASAKWHGRLQIVLKCPIDTAWELTTDFTSMQRWLPTVERCECVEGKPQEVGCVRYAIGKAFPRPDGGESWAYEKLLLLDQSSRTMSYAMLENNFGFSGYVAVYKMVDQGNGEFLVDWSYEVNPVPNSTEQKVSEFMTGTFARTLRKLEARLNSE